MGLNSTPSFIGKEGRQQTIYIAGWFAGLTFHIPKDGWGAAMASWREMWKTHQGLEEGPILIYPPKKTAFFLVVDFISKAGNGFRSYNSGSVFPSWDWEILKYWTFSKKPHWLISFTGIFSSLFFLKFFPALMAKVQHGLILLLVTVSSPEHLLLACRTARRDWPSTYSPEVFHMEPEVMMLSKKESPNFQGADFQVPCEKLQWGKIKSYFRKDVLLNCHLQSGEVVSYSLHSLNLHCQIWFPCDCSLKIVIYCHRLHIYIFIHRKVDLHKQSWLNLIVNIMYVSNCYIIVIP